MNEQLLIIYLLLNYIMLEQYYMKNPVSTGDEVGLRVVKILAIGFVFMLYLIIGFYVGLFLDNNVFGTFTKEKKRKNKKLYTRYNIFFEVCYEFAIVGMLLYFVRNLVEFAISPIPLQGLFGFNWGALRDLKAGYGFTYMCLLYQENLRNKLLYLAHRL